MSNKKIKIVVVVDISGSMENQAPVVRTKLREAVNQLDANQVDFGVATFSERFDGIQWNRWDIGPVRGATALYDSCVETIQDLSSQFDASDKVLICVITDGGNNAGSARVGQVASEVHVAEEILAWDFLFVGTNQNAYKVGADMGVKASKALSFANSSEGFEHMLDSLKSIFPQWVAGNIAHDGEFFSEEVRTTQAELGAIKF